MDAGTFLIKKPFRGPTLPIAALAAAFMATKYLTYCLSSFGRSTMKLSANARAILVAAIFLLGSMAVAAPIGAQGNYDVVIINGRVMDPESGLDNVRNVGISAGKIRAISAGPLVGKTKIDARNLVVAPGFIDLHQHGQDAQNDKVKAADGVTTSLELELGVADVDSWYDARGKNALINFGASIGHIPVRMAVMHDPGDFLPSGDAAHRPATAAELEQIQAEIDKGLHRGALAVGLGPAYTPAATNWEILEVFQTAARFAVSVHVHIRANTPAEGNLTGFQEVLADAAATGAPLHVVHIQSTGGPNVLHELEMIRGARARGLDVTTEAYPYDRGMTRIESALYDNMENQPDRVFASLLWPATGEHLTRESFLRYRKTGGLIIAPVTTPEMVRAAVIDPLTMIASDGRLVAGNGHPRTAGTFARVLGEYVRQEKALSLMDALRKMTLMPAQRLEKHAPVFRDKGRIRVGADADITVFDRDKVIDKATYEQPLQYSEGIQFVFVNGTLVVKDGKLVDGVFPGRPARAPIVSAK
jgi:N-acyl-D-aspartate/D-glutamate deacylase